MKPLQHNRNARKRARAFAEKGWVALWGGVAVLFGVVGMSSVFLTADMQGQSAATLLPPAGEVATTASISRDRPINADGALQVFPSSGGMEAVQDRQQIKGEVDVLRREIAALKRTVAVLQEQRDMALLATERTNDANTTQARQKSDFGARVDAAVEAVVGKPQPVETVPAPSAANTKIQSEPTTSASPETATLPTPDIEEALPKGLQEPVRIVALPGTRVPDIVASIPPSAAPQTPAGDAQASLTLSPAAGRISGEGTSRIARSDFGLDLGGYETEDAARTAWSQIKETQTSLPQGIGLKIVTDAETGQSRLYAGPFANAADAAAACVYLDTQDITCSPGLFPTDRLATRPQ